MTSNLSVSDLTDSVKSALDYLHENLGYESESVLGKGTYGSVVLVTHPDLGQLAAKIVERRMLNEMEIIIWPKLEHRNILKLNDAICDMHSVIIFLTDLMETNLFLRLQNKDFKADPKALERCRIYAKQVFDGLAYLHRNKLCHLDLRAENVFLAPEDDRAVVADFSGLTWAESEKRFCPLPRSLRPPEMLTPAKRKVPPLPVDLWACGLLLANMFLGKGFYMCTVKNSRAGHVDAVYQYTSLFQCEEYVKRFLRETYSACTLTQVSIKNFMNLMNRFLQIAPKIRLRLDEALSHPFLVQPILGRIKEIEICDKVILDLPLTVQDGLEKSIMDTVGNSERFEVILSKYSDKKIESESIDKNLTMKKTKSRWEKYRHRFFVMKLPFRSAPLFKTIRFKKDSTKKPKRLEKLKSDTTNLT